MRHLWELPEGLGEPANGSRYEASITQSSAHKSYAAEASSGNGCNKSSQRKDRTQKQHGSVEPSAGSEAGLRHLAQEQPHGGELAFPLYFHV